MEVILKQDVDKVGKFGTVVKVKDGYARNFLFPRGLAMPLTAGNLKRLERERQAAEARSASMKKEAQALKERLAGISLTMPGLIKDGEDEELYGSITSQDIEAALKEEGFNIDKTAIMLLDPIRKLGIYEVSVRLHAEVDATVKIWVVKK
ncbi:MAG: 50S ribosomal protein L9 [Candidatus Omnitrophica bacterium]|nr:50S ribosomal protein L9 [Candidatus Omnitrophota bacterium]